MPETFTYHFTYGTIRTEADMSEMWNDRSDMKDNAPSLEKAASNTDKSMKVETKADGTCSWNPQELAGHYHTSESAGKSPRSGRKVSEGHSWSPRSLDDHFDFIQSTPPSEVSKKPARAQKRKAVDRVD